MLLSSAIDVGCIQETALHGKRHVGLKFGVIRNRFPGLVRSLAAAGKQCDCTDRKRADQ